MAILLTWSWKPRMTSSTSSTCTSSSVRMPGALGAQPMPTHHSAHERSRCEPHTTGTSSHSCPLCTTAAGSASSEGYTTTVAISNSTCGVCAGPMARAR